MARFWLLLFLMLPAGAIDPGNTVLFGRGYPGSPIPTFDRGYLLFINTRGDFEVWGPDGRQRFFTTVENPPAASVGSLAVDSDGSVAAGIAFRGPRGRGGGLAYFDSSGKQTRFVDTGRYIPANVHFGPDHALWTFGLQPDASDDSEEHDYMMFRKYSADGKEAGRYGPRSLFPKGLAPGSASGGFWRIRVADDRVGALAYSGRTSERQVWIELGLDGRLMGQWPLGPYPDGGLAFTSDARLCRQRLGDSPMLECFDRSAAAWKPAGPAPPRSLLLGAQGDEFVFGHDEGVIRLTWARIP